jgi:hypothetical protein
LDIGNLRFARPVDDFAFSEPNPTLALAQSAEATATDAEPPQFEVAELDPPDDDPELSVDDLDDEVQPEGLMPQLFLPLISSN